jgi:hypothetical protein
MQTSLPLLPRLLIVAPHHSVTTPQPNPEEFPSRIPVPLISLYMTTW